MIIINIFVPVIKLPTTAIHICCFSTQNSVHGNSTLLLHHTVIIPIYSVISLPHGKNNTATLLEVPRLYAQLLPPHDSKW
jgi:hypothetical protein